MMNRQAALGAIYAGLAVIFGAFGAHSLEGRLAADMLEVFETGVRYQMYHALGMLLIGLLAGRREQAGGLLWSGRLMHAGIWLFSGSLYVLSLSGITWLGAITPLGGVCFIAAWAMLAINLWKRS